MTEFAAWLLQLVKDLLTGLWTFLQDVFIELLDLMLKAVLALITALPVPSFMSTGLQSTLNAIGTDVWFFASHLRFAECFGVLAAAVAFRLARKFVTLFQW